MFTITRIIFSFSPPPPGAFSCDVVSRFKVLFDGTFIQNKKAS